MNTFDIDSTVKAIEGLLSGGGVERSVPMKKLTTFKIGGPADILYTAASNEEAAEVISFCKGKGLPYFYMGNGSNLLVKDGGYRGIIIRPGLGMSRISVEGNNLKAGAGARLSTLASTALEAALSGLEFAAGIPGSVGGAVMMNAGAYDMEIKDTIKSATAILPDGNIKSFSVGELDLSYRHSIFTNNEAMIVEAEFELKKGSKDDITAKIKDLNDRRRKKQPLEFPSAGSTFKRPTGDYAGRLIEASGCSNLACGGARVSPKHSGFIINDANATAADVLNLIAIVQMRVKEFSGIDLETEIRIIGE